MPGSMGVLLMQPLVRGTAFLALLALLPADGKLYAAPLSEPVPARPAEREDEHRPPSPVLAQTIPDLDLRRTPLTPDTPELERAADVAASPWTARPPRPRNSRRPVALPRPALPPLLVGHRPTGPPRA